MLGDKFYQIKMKLDWTFIFWAKFEEYEEQSSEVMTRVSKD